MSIHKMYYWAPSMNQGGVGHAALDIDFGAGPGKAQYVSWWPGGTGSKGSPGANINGFFENFRAVLSNYIYDSGQTFEKDPVTGAFITDTAGNKIISGEQRSPDETIEIHDCLDADRMRSAFSQMQKSLIYVIATQSCATAVANVLLLGGGMLSPTVKNFADNITYWSPSNAATLASLIRMDAATIKEGVDEGFKMQHPFWDEVAIFISQFHPGA